MTIRVAIVHDWLVTYGGAERVLESILEQFPGAPIYTLVYRPEVFRGTRIESHPVYASFIQRLPGGVNRYRQYLFLMPFAIEQFDFGEYDVVISSSHAVAKGVLTRSDQVHISYVHTPMRYAWDLQFQYLRDSGLARGIRGWIARLMLHYIRLWDTVSADRVDVFIANSEYVAQRIWKTYRRTAKVVYPPVNVSRFDYTRPREDFYLTVSRMVSYKRIDLIVQAFSRVGLPLVVIGDGPDFEKVKRLAGPNVQLLGYQPDPVVRDYMERCRAFVFAADEDFGIAPVEAQAAGAPVIAYGKGGVTETVVAEETGILFSEQSVDALVAAVRQFESQRHRFDPKRIRRNAERFGKERFQEEFLAVFKEAISQFGSQTRAEFALE